MHYNQNIMFLIIVFSDYLWLKHLIPWAAVIDSINALIVWNAGFFVVCKVLLHQEIGCKWQSYAYKQHWGRFFTDKNAAGWTYGATERITLYVLYFPWSKVSLLKLSLKCLYYILHFLVHKCIATLINSTKFVYVYYHHKTFYFNF